MADFTGTAADDVFNAPAASPTTGAAATTVNSGDTLDGGAGNDTLNIIASATNNNSLSGLVVKAIETVNITGSDNLGASSPAFAAAQDAKAVTAAALTSARAVAALAVGGDAAADMVSALAASGTVTATINSFTTTTVTPGVAELAVTQASTATVAGAETRAAALNAFAALIKTELDAYTAASGNTAANGLALANKINTLATSATANDFGTIPTTGATYAAADIRAVASLVRTAADGTSLTAAAVAVDASDSTKVAAGLALASRNAVVSQVIADVNVVAQSTLTTDNIANQEAAAAVAVANGISDAILADIAGSTTAVLGGVATGTGLTGQFTRLNTTSFTVQQFLDAAKATLTQGSGATSTTSNRATRADELAISKSLIAAVDVDFSIAQLNAAATNATRDATGTTLLTNGDDGAAITARATALATAAETAKGNALTAADAALASDTAAGNALTVALAGVGATTVSAAQFADATAITLLGSSSKANVTGVAATQTIGFSDVTSMENAVTFGSTVAAGSLALSGSTGALTVTGATMAALSVSGTGTGTTGIALTDNGQAVTTAGVDTVATLNLSTSGATVLDVTAMTALKSVTQTGAGGVTLTSGAAVASVTTGAGADLVKSVTATVENLINASVTSGAGDDRLVIATTGSGRTAVDAGGGNDTVYLNATGSGANTVALGDGNDTLRNELGTGLIAGLSNTKVDGGAGTDTLRVANTGFAASDYAILTANVSSVETLQLSADVGTMLANGLDASKVAMTTFDVRGTGVSYIAEVSASQTVSVSRTATSSVLTGFIDAVPAVAPDGVSVASKGYLLDSDSVTGGNQTVWGDNLRVNLSGTNGSANTTSAVALGNVLALSVAPLNTTGTSGASSAVAGINTVALVTGDLKGVDVTLSSLRGSGTNGLGAENVGGLTIAMTSTNLQNLTSLKVSGAGVATISTSDTTITAAAAKLTTIDLSAMTAFANVNTVGLELNDSNVYQNMSTSSVTLNNLVSETVILGAARDTIVTGSTFAARDTVTGFQLTANATDATLVDTTKSDVLKIGTAFSTTTAAKMTTTATTLEGALLEASIFKVAGSNVDNVVFHFGGNTFVYVDAGTANVLDDADRLVQLTGTLNLDLLLQTGVVIV